MQWFCAILSEFGSLAVGKLYYIFKNSAIMENCYFEHNFNNSGLKMTHFKASVTTASQTFHLT